MGLGTYDNAIVPQENFRVSLCFEESPPLQVYSSKKVRATPIICTNKYRTHFAEDGVAA